MFGIFLSLFYRETPRKTREEKRKKRREGPKVENAILNMNRHQRRRRRRRKTREEAKIKSKKKKKKKKKKTKRKKRRVVSLVRYSTPAARALSSLISHLQLNTGTGTGSGRQALPASRIRPLPFLSSFVFRFLLLSKTKKRLIF